MGQQAVFDDERRDGAGAGGVEECVMPDTEPAGDEEFHALIGKELCLELRVAHGFMLQLRLDLLETELFLGEAAVLAADAVALEALLRVETRDVARFGIKSDAEGQAEPLIAHRLGKLRRLLQPRDVAVEGTLDIGRRLHDPALFL